MRRFQRIAATVYRCQLCCRRLLSNETPAVQPPKTPASDLIPAVQPPKTPASDLSSIYKEPYNNDLKILFGGAKDDLFEITDDTKFEDFKALRPFLTWKLKELGFEKPLPVQSRTLEATLRGRDAVIKSVTGSGKTLAYVIPLLNKVGYQRIGTGVRGRRYPQAVIVAPTRELCIQISSVIEGFIGDERLINMIGGGNKVRVQAKEAREGNKDIIIATPGRVMQLISMNIIRPEELKFLVLDEADELLHDLFYRHMRWVLDNSNSSKQMIVTTATVPVNVQFVIDRYMKYHAYIDLGRSAVSVPEQIKHKAVLYDMYVFKRALQWVLKTEHRGCSIVFVRFKRDCEKVTELVRSWGYTVKYCSSEVLEPSRRQVMSEFSAGQLEVLVATDVAARGVDVPECSCVVHVKPQLDKTKYLHRSGRTGRAGRAGTSVLMLINDRAENMDFLGDLSVDFKFDYALYTNKQRYKLIPKDANSTQAEDANNTQAKDAKSTQAHDHDQRQAHNPYLIHSSAIIDDDS